MYDCRLPDYALPFDAEAFQAGKKRLAMESLQVRRYLSWDPLTAGIALYYLQ